MYIFTCLPCFEIARDQIPGADKKHPGEREREEESALQFSTKCAPSLFTKYKETKQMEIV